MTELKDIDEKYLDYPTKVLNGEILACEAIKLQCKRYLELFKRDDVYFDAKDVDKVVKFCERLLQLQPWQKWLIYQIYGFRLKKNGYRLIREAYIQLPRKSGKTSLLAALALYGIIDNCEADVAFYANSRSQAQLASTISKNYVDSIDPNGKFLKQYRDSIKYTSAKTKKLDDVHLIHTAIIDEFHNAQNWDLYNVLKSSMNFKSQPLLLTCTTARFNLYEPCKELYDTAKSILHGKIENDNLAIFIFELDDNDDIEDENNWIKCQPNLDYLVSRDYLKSELIKVKNNPALLTIFKTKLMNIWSDEK